MRSSNGTADFLPLIALNSSVDTATRAFVAGGSTVKLNGGSLNLTATSATKSESEAKPKQDGVTGKSLGFGASVALSLVDNLTEAEVGTGAHGETEVGPSGRCGTPRAYGAGTPAGWGGNRDG